MDVRPPLVPDNKAPKPMNPRKCPLDDPSIAAESRARLDTFARDSRRDAAHAGRDAEGAIIVSFVRMELLRSTPWTTTRPSDGLHGVQHGDEHLSIVEVGRRHLHTQGDAVLIDEEVILRAWPAPVGRIRAGFWAPFFAGTIEASSAARSQAILSARPSSSSKSWCNRSQTPACCQSRSRRQQVIPLHPSSCGRSSHGMPVRSTKRMPVRATRFGTGGRPPHGLGRWIGKRGSMRSQSPSGTNSLPIPARVRSVLRLSSNRTQRGSVRYS
jgi:hypothetical protein